MATKKAKPAPPLTAQEVHGIIDEAVAKIRAHNVPFSLLIGALRCSTINVEQDYSAALQHARGPQ